MSVFGEEPQKEERQKPEKKSSSSRVEAGLVEENFEQQPNDEVVAAGEHIDFEQLEERTQQQAALGAPIAGVVPVQPSTLNNPYMSPEEQHMEMTPAVVGPPAYGSPDPTTSAAKLVPLEQHALNAENLPEGSDSAISEDYGADVAGGTLAPAEGTHPGGPASTEIAPTDEGSPEESRTEEEYEGMTMPELKRLAKDRGLEGYSQLSKDELIGELQDYDQENEANDQEND